MGLLHHFGRTALLGGAALLVPLAAGCTGASGEASHPGHGGGKAAAPATIEQLAARTGCTLTGKRAADELRQGACRTGEGRYTLVGFSTDQGQRAWLEEAKPWGGSYLVGTRWVAVGAPQTLQALRQDLGGEVMNGAHHGG
ncbi:hypothetical protein [Actinomadura hibisca]|uniref:hypothetical protein n=1 Tax=Actinomadura hibisca TaxID=68565 RepID=UPI00082E30EB|nr:hypothetical protein [Actinomadura hibisca]